MRVLRESTISFEFFPPKTLEGMVQLRETGMVLAQYDPRFFSVTFGAGGSTRKGTLETIDMLLRKTPITIAPHLACLGSTREEIQTLLADYKAMDLKNIVALRGDLPKDSDKAGDFTFATELVEFIRKETGDHFHIEVAAYPEFHPQALNAQDDIFNLKRKFEAGADSAITQYFFNPDAYFYYLDDCARLDIHMPIIPGIMPINHFGKLVRFSEMCGAEIPRWIYKRLEYYQNDDDALRKLGVEIVHDLCETLIAGGAPGLHFYTLNKLDAVVEIIEMLGFTAWEDEVVTKEKVRA